MVEKDIKTLDCIVTIHLIVKVFNKPIVQTGRRFLMKLNKLLFSIILSGITASLTCAGISAQEEKTVQDQYDIVIIGAGAAGMNAAIHAYDEGDANIVILESLPYAGGGSSKAYGGIYSSSVSYETDPSADGDNDTTIDELFEAGLEASAGADEEIQRFYAEHAHETLEWLNDLGYRWGTVHYGNLYRPSDGSGVGDQLTKVLLEQIKARDIEIRYNTTATRILTGEDGTITGVHAENSKNGSYDIATGCIILATGGYANNQEMLRQYNPEFAAAYVNNSPGSNGMGILMAQQLGADVVNMENLYLFETVEPDNIQHPFLFRGLLRIKRSGCGFDICGHVLASGAACPGTGGTGISSGENCRCFHVTANPRHVLYSESEE